MMNTKRLAGALLASAALLIVAGALAQSNGGGSNDLSKEWPTYGHDPGGMRFSPLTQITPANVGADQGGMGVSHEARRLRRSGRTFRRRRGAAPAARWAIRRTAPGGAAGAGADAAGRDSGRAKIRRW